MGTPRDSEATKRAIIEAAGRLFAEKGFSGVTAREVAGDAGVALSAIPYHFGSMDALYRETLLTACQVSPDAAPLAEEALAGDPEVGLRTAIRWAIVDASSASSSWAFRLLDREEADPSPVYEEVLRIKVVPEWNWLCEVVARASGHKSDSREVKFGVIAMYDLTATLHIRSGMIDHLAPD
ncbi:MAG: TetR/AcrR family transcriptional regulator, partial [bacterium]